MFDERVSVGRPERLLESAADLVRRRVDVIVTGLDPETHAAKGATDSIPIVVLAATDPVGNGFVASLARPGGNVTGVTFDAGFDVASKRIELLKAAAPKAKTVGFLFNPEFPGMAGYVVRDSKEIRAAFAAIKHARPDALFVGSGWPTTVDDRQRVIDFTIESRLPAMFVNLAWMKQGGLMAYLPSDQDRARRVAVLIDKILKGARPGDLSIEQPTKFDLVINLRTAKALGLTVPPSLLMRADQLIE